MARMLAVLLCLFVVSACAQDMCSEPTAITITGPGPITTPNLLVSCNCGSVGTCSGGVFEHDPSGSFTLTAITTCGSSFGCAIFGGGDLGSSIARLTCSAGSCSGSDVSSWPADTGSGLTSCQTSFGSTCAFRLTTFPATLFRFQQDSIFFSGIVAEGTGGGGDDPFVGFAGQRFNFHGKPHHAFHIYSDPNITINSRFAVANPTRGKGTVMSAFGIRWENHTITFDVQSSVHNNTALRLLIDGAELLLPLSSKNGKRRTQLDTCISATFRFPKLYIQTPLHEIRVDWKTERTDHINGSYLNIKVSAPLEEKGLRFGGVLGQTASVYNVSALSKRKEDFAVSDDMVSGMEALTSTFDARPLLCAAVATRPPVIAAVEHVHRKEEKVRFAVGRDA